MTPGNVVDFPAVLVRSCFTLLQSRYNAAMLVYSYLGAFGSGPAQGDLEQSRKLGADSFTFDVYRSR